MKEIKSPRKKFIEKLIQFMKSIDKIDKTCKIESDWWVDMMDIHRKCVNFKIKYEKFTPQDYIDEYKSCYKEFYGKDIEVTYHNRWYNIGKMRVELNEFKKMIDDLYHSLANYMKLIN